MAGRRRPNQSYFHPISKPVIAEEVPDPFCTNEKLGGETTWEDPEGCPLSVELPVIIKQSALHNTLKQSAFCGLRLLRKAHPGARCF